MRKICKVCSKKFEAQYRTERTCDEACGAIFKIREDKKKAEKAARKRKKEFYDNDTKTQLAKAQDEVNRWIRTVRDADEPCISCGYDWKQHHKDDWRQAHAGHFISRGESSLLRFHEWNIHKQCSICNNWKSGEVAEYRKNLINKIGIEAVEWLESQRKKTKSWDIDEVKAIKNKYKFLCKENEKQSTIYDILHKEQTA